MSGMGSPSCYQPLLSLPLDPLAYTALRGRVMLTDKHCLVSLLPLLCWARAGRAYGVRDQGDQSSLV